MDQEVKLALRKVMAHAYSNVEYQAVYDIADSLNLEYSLCKKCDAETPTIEFKTFDECCLCGEEK